jgi:hypothetical protein
MNKVWMEFGGGNWTESCGYGGGGGGEWCGFWWRRSVLEDGRYIMSKIPVIHV